MAKKEVELDFDVFIASIENWDGASPPFDEVVRSALLHATLMHRGEECTVQLADRLECIPLSLSRYAVGTSRPHPGMMKIVVREVRAILIDLRTQSREAHGKMIVAMRNIGNAGPDD